jgi:hypothetical protein
MFENIMLRRIFRPKRGEFIAGQQKLCNEEPDVRIIDYYSPKTVRVITSMISVRLLARNSRIVYILVITT